MHKYFEGHDIEWYGVDEFTGVKMGRCRRCGKFDTTISGEYWELEQLEKRYKDLLERIGCKTKKETK